MVVMNKNIVLIGLLVFTTLVLTVSCETGTGPATTAAVSIEDVLTSATVDTFTFPASLTGQGVSASSMAASSLTEYTPGTDGAIRSTSLESLLLFVDNEVSTAFYEALREAVLAESAQNGVAFDTAINLGQAVFFGSMDGLPARIRVDTPSTDEIRIVSRITFPDSSPSTNGEPWPGMPAVADVLVVITLEADVVESIAVTGHYRSTHSAPTEDPVVGYEEYQFFSVFERNGTVKTGFFFDGEHLSPSNRGGYAFAGQPTMTGPGARDFIYLAWTGDEDYEGRFQSISIGHADDESAAVQFLFYDPPEDGSESPFDDYRGDTEFLTRENGLIQQIVIVDDNEPFGDRGPAFDMIMADGSELPVRSRYLLQGIVPRDGKSVFVDGAIPDASDLDDGDYEPPSVFVLSDSEDESDPNDNIEFEQFTFWDFDESTSRQSVGLVYYPEEPLSDGPSDSDFTFPFADLVATLTSRLVDVYDDLVGGPSADWYVTFMQVFPELPDDPLFAD